MPNKECWWRARLVALLLLFFAILVFLSQSMHITGAVKFLLWRVLLWIFVSRAYQQHANDSVAMKLRARESGPCAVCVHEACWDPEWCTWHWVEVAESAEHFWAHLPTSRQDVKKKGPFFLWIWFFRCFTIPVWKIGDCLRHSSLCLPHGQSLEHVGQLLPPCVIATLCYVLAFLRFLL